MKDVSTLLQARLDEEHIVLLDLIAKTGASSQVKVYIVGGFVRDLLLNIKNLDIDLVVEGDGISFAKILADKLNGQTQNHKKFGTSTLNLEGFPVIDLATARTEYYSHSAALPEVKPSEIELDLARRDFTINSMAIKLSGQGMFHLIDLFGGEIDLKDGLIRILHDQSFVDDPSRIFRAIRFEQRFGFCIENQTKNFMARAIENNFIGRLSGDRLINEIKILLKESFPEKCIDRMRELSLLQGLIPEIFDDEFRWVIIKKIDSTLSWSGKVPMSKKPEVWFVYLYALFMLENDDAFEEMMMRLNFPRNIYGRMCLDRKCFVKAMCDLNNEQELSPSEVYDIFSKQSSEVVIILLVACSSERVKKYAELYFNEYCKSANIELNGNDLIEMGIKPGPIFNDVLKALRDARLNGQVESLDEEIVLVKSQFLK
jgi:tRNA nucleotidyltransferase (CCA-adding enzyme)